MTPNDALSGLRSALKPFVTEAIKTRPEVVHGWQSTVITLDPVLLSIRYLDDDGKLIGQYIAQGTPELADVAAEFVVTMSGQMTARTRATVLGILGAGAGRLAVMVTEDCATVLLVPTGDGEAIELGGVHIQPTVH